MPVAFASGEFFRVGHHPWAVPARQVQVTHVDGTCFSCGRAVGKAPAKGMALAESLVLPQPCGLPSKAKGGEAQGFSRGMVSTVLQDCTALGGRSSGLSEQESAILFIPAPIVSTTGARCT